MAADVFAGRVAANNRSLLRFVTAVERVSLLLSSLVGNKASDLGVKRRTRFKDDILAKGSCLADGFGGLGGLKCVPRTRTILLNTQPIGTSLGDKCRDRLSDSSCASPTIVTHSLSHFQQSYG